MPAMMNIAYARIGSGPRRHTPWGGLGKEATRVVTAASAARQRRLTSQSGQTYSATAITRVRAQWVRHARGRPTLSTTLNSTAQVPTSGNDADIPHLDDPATQSSQSSLQFSI